MLYFTHNISLQGDTTMDYEFRISPYNDPSFVQQISCALEKSVKAKLFCPEIAGLFCRIAGLFCHDSRANLSLKPVCFGIAIS